MSLLLWSVVAATLVIVVSSIVQVLGRAGRTRALLLDEVRRFLRGGVLERPPGRGPQVRGRLGELELTVDLPSDPQRPAQSPMWRVIAVGPVALDSAVEARVGSWSGWIDPWMRSARSVVVPAGVGPSISVHAEEPVTLDHPVVVALRRQGPSLGPGGLHARRDFMRAEVKFDSHLERNRALFGFIQAMAEIAEQRPASASRPRRMGSSAIEAQGSGA